MKIIRLALCWTSVLLGGTLLHAQSWTPAGPDAMDQPSKATTIANIVSDHAGGMIYAYKELLDNKASVRKWDGSHWQPVGAPSFSGGVVDYLALAAAPSGTPYVVYKDYSATGKATVMTFNGSSWVNVGGPVSGGGASHTFITIDNAGVPYVAYADSLLSGRITVKKWDGTTWQPVGTSGFTPPAIGDLKIRLNSSGQPYVLAQYASGSSGQSEVYTYNGTAWNSLGVAGQTSVSFSDKTADLAISPLDIPMVAFADNSLGKKVTVKEFNGTAWINVGAAGFSPNPAAEIQLRVDPLNGPYLFCLSNYYPGSSEAIYPMIRHFNGTSWEVAGPDSFIVSNATPTPAFDLDTAHAPCVLSGDNDGYYKMVMRRLEGSQWKIKGASEGLAKVPASLTVSAASPDGAKAYCVATNQFTANFTPSRVCRFDDTAWTVIGTSNPASWRGRVMDIAVHPNGHPWIVVADTVPFSTEYTVWRHTDTGWVNTEINLTTLGGAESLCFDGAGNAYFANMPYVGPLFVKKYTQGSGWSTLNGSPIPSNTSVDYVRIKVNHDGVPHLLVGVHYSTTGLAYSFWIYNYTGTAWASAAPQVTSNNGAPAGSTPDFAFDTADVIHVAFLNNGMPAIAVRKLNTATNTFTDVVPAGSAPNGQNPQIQFAPDGSLYLSYAQKADQYYASATVKRLAGNAWQNVGSPLFSVTTSYAPQLLFYNNKLLTTISDGAAFAYQYSCATPVVITQAPADTVVCDGANAAFLTAANGASGYRWQMNSGQGWNNVPANATYSGVNSATLVVTAATAAMNGNQFRCVYTGACDVPAMSTPATLLIDVPGLPAPGVHIASDKPATCQGNEVTFTATATQPGVWYTYEWLINGTAVIGATDSVFTTASLSASDAVTCRFTRLSACGSAPAVAMSNALSVAVSPSAAPSVNITAAPGTTVPSGQPVTFTASVTNGGAAPQYQWLVNDNPVTGATASSFTTSTLNNGDAVKVKVTRSDTCAAVNTALSPALTIQVTTGIRETSKQYGFRVYPQPARDQVTLSGSAGMPAGAYQLSLYSVTGQLLISEQVKVAAQAWTYRLPLPASLPAGLYRMTFQHPGLTLGTTLTIVR
ncbi:hypothetical protein [Taibaiella koreensis]|uniref:hypothetical protein n=1 Tax=Taibaiella koreensis TaxID=1268548 RepID=UPI000E59C692|nr:hypothetical protein [Taibaiella koreensis]